MRSRAKTARRAKTRRRGPVFFCQAHFRTILLISLIFYVKEALLAGLKPRLLRLPGEISRFAGCFSLFLLRHSWPAAAANNI